MLSSTTQVTLNWTPFGTAIWKRQQPRMQNRSLMIFWKWPSEDLYDFIQLTWIGKRTWMGKDRRIIWNLTLHSAVSIDLYDTENCEANYNFTTDLLVPYCRIRKAPSTVRSKLWCTSGQSGFQLDQSSKRGIQANVDGWETAVAIARAVINGAHRQAKSTASRLRAKSGNFCTMDSILRAKVVGVSK